MFALTCETWFNVTLAQNNIVLLHTFSKTGVVDIIYSFMKINNRFVNFSSIPIAMNVSDWGCFGCFIQFIAKTSDIFDNLDVFTSILIMTLHFFRECYGKFKKNKLKNVQES